MASREILGLVLILYITLIAPAHCEYYSKTLPLPYDSFKHKVTNLHFFFHDKLSGPNPSAVLVAGANITNYKFKSPIPFGVLYAIDDPLTVGPEPESEVIGNALGLYVSSGRDSPSLVAYFDFGFTSGEFNGSSISVFSRNPIIDTERELAVVGGRGKFRLARGFAQLRTYSLNATNGDAIVEYNVTVFHH